MVTQKVKKLTKKQQAGLRELTREMVETRFFDDGCGYYIEEKKNQEVTCKNRANLRA